MGKMAGKNGCDSAVDNRLLFLKNEHVEKQSNW
jgi:hypothetical protein